VYPLGKRKKIKQRMLEYNNNEKAKISASAQNLWSTKMIDIDYMQFGLLKSKMVWFTEQLPSTKGYHYMSCKCCYNKVPYHHPFSQREIPTVLIDLSLDTSRLFEDIHSKRRQKIRRAYKEKVSIVPQELTRDLLKEFVDLYRKFQVPKGNYFTSPWIIKGLKKNVKVFKGMHYDQVLIMDLVLHDGCTAHRWMRVRNEAIKSQASTYIGGTIVWEIIQHFKKKDYQILDLGGQNHYLRSFGGGVVPSYSYIAILSLAAKAIFMGKPIFSRLPGLLLKLLFDAKMKESC
jgi:hypothetical protein